MTFVAAAIAATATLGGAYMTSRAAKGAAQTAAEASGRAADVQREIFERQTELQEPWRQAGINALAQLQGRTGTMPAAFQYRPEQLTTDPGYAFRLAEGMKALERSVAARGGLLSGGTGRALQRYGQEMASQEYGNAFGRALTEYNAARAREAEEYNRLAGLAGIGGTASQQIASQAGQLGSNLGNIYMQQGQIAGQAQLARGGAYQRAGSDIASLLGRFYGPQGYGQRSNYLAPVEDRSFYSAPGFEAGMDEYYSDARLKTDVRKIDTRADGLGVYEFNYVWGGPRYVGLMAQEVQALYPDAVSERGGYLMVDYRKV